jgi:lipopolysaccharide export system protein LptA
MKRWALIAVGLGLTLAGPAGAQLAPDSNAPIDITADELEVINAQCVAVWRGGAEALQETSRLRADEIRIYNKAGVTKPAAAGEAAETSCGELERIEARGNVYYVTPQRRVRGDNGVYVATGETLTMTGNVVAAQGKNVLQGETLIVQVKTGEARMDTPIKGRNKPGRVRGVFYPSEKGEQAAAPAAR